MSGVFNIKLIQYENGAIELRRYSQPIGAQFLGVSENEFKEMQLEGLLSDICRPECVYNPFSEKKELILTLDQQQILAMRQARSLKVSFNRTVNELYKLARQCKWDYFVTLTFSKEKIDRYDYSACMKKANKWFHNQRRCAPDLQYLFVPEMHKDGAWHIHGLIARVGGMQFVDSGKRAKGKVIYNLSGWHNGFSTATSVEDTNKVSGYITKYITKDLCAFTKGRKRYYRSQNIPAPKEDEFFVEGTDLDSFIEKVENSFGVALDYEKTVEGFVNVDYKYFKAKGESNGKGKN